jgi:betaine reductase
MNPVIRNCAFCLVHTPDLVRYGSKPRRQISVDASQEERLRRGLRPYRAAVDYPPNQTFIGNLSPEELAALPRPWFEARAKASPTGPFGEIISQDLFYAVLKQADVLQPPLVELTEESSAELHGLLKGHGVLKDLDRGRWQASKEQELSEILSRSGSLALTTGNRLHGCVRRDDRAEGREDDNLTALLLLEALSVKASAAIALRSLLHREGMAPEAVDYLISCGEEAVGDRYQRGGGGMAKVVGELCGCSNASGMDIKNFCAAPASALITAGALVKAGVYERVAVVAGGSLAKLGMKSAVMLDHELPVLGDCLGCMAFLVTRDDGVSPILHLEPGAVGTARIGSSVSDELVYRQLVLEPLAALGLTMADVNKYAPELHNAELMEHAGAGDVSHKSYRMIAALGVISGAIDKADMQSFIERVGMVGYAPPQGHIPSGVTYIGHAMQAMREGRLKRVMFLSKASLFLNRLTDLYDGVSFLLEANPGTTKEM